MPIYSYRCMACGHAFDRLVKRDQAEQAQPCPKGCAPADSQRQLSAPAGFDLKGTGWYSKGNH